MSHALKILHLEDVATDAELISRQLKKQLNCTIKVVETGGDYEEALETFSPDIVLSDHTLPFYSSFKAFDVLKSKQCDVPFILVTGSVSDEFAAEAIKLGVDDYIVKDRLHRLPAAVDKAVRGYHLKKQRELLLHKEQKNKEAILKLSERLLLATKAANVGIWDWNVQTNKFEVDETLYRLFGFSNTLSEPSYNWLKYLHPDDKSRIESHIIGALKGLNELNFDYRIIWADGSVHHCKTVGAVHRNEDGRATRMVGTCWDITERKQIEQQLKNNNERYELVTKASNDVIWEWEVATDHLFFTEIYTKIFGYPTHEQWSQYQQRIHPEDREKVLSKLGLLLANPLSNFWEDEYRYQKADGSYAFVYDRGYLVVAETGKITRFVGALTDITAKKKAEAEREVMIKDVIQRNKDLEQFAYIVSHNLRAPVANILGLTKLLCKTDCLTHTEQNEFITALGTSADKLDCVIKDLSQILQVGKTLEEKKELISLENIITDISVSIHSLMQSENVEIQTDFQLNEITTLKSYVFSIFNNLITNSIKYSRPGMHPIIKVTSEINNDQVIIKFKDNGLGIDLDRYGQQIFGLYKRFHPSVEGKGMGLFMIKKQVEALSGSISVSSKVNEGTSFTVTLPL